MQKFETANIRELHSCFSVFTNSAVYDAVRIVAFSVRAYMQKHLTQNLAIVYEVSAVRGYE